MADGAVESSKIPGDGLVQGRIEFRSSGRPFTATTAVAGGNFRLQALNPGRHRPASSLGPTPSSSTAAVAASSGASRKRSGGGGEFHYRGLDPELGFEITFRRIGAGLENLGNTCYLNSVLQCLTYTEPFAAYLQSGKHKSSCRTAGFCAMCALQNHVMDALRSTGKILRPFHLVNNLRYISRNFHNSRQEDAHEYMVNLLESMHKCCLPSGIASESPNAYEKSLVHKIFGGRLRSQVKCMQCSYCSNKFDPFLDLSLEITKADTLHKALSHFTAVEPLDGGEKQYQCQQCKQKVRAVKQLTIHKAPYVLTVHLKRFSSALPGQKINKKVDFEPTLDLKGYVSDPSEGDLKYTLYGVLVHAGHATHSGHYYCFVRTSSGLWYSLNDHEVYQVHEKTVLQQKAYMLFYVRNIRRTAPKTVLDLACKEDTLANASGSKDVSAYSPHSKQAIQDCPREIGSRQRNTISKIYTSSLSVSVPLKDTSVEKPLMKKITFSSCFLAKGAQGSALSEYIFPSSSNISSTKEPLSTEIPISSVLSVHLVEEGLMEKASSRDNCNQCVVKDPVWSAQIKDQSVSSFEQAASTGDNLVPANSLVEDCSVAPASAHTSMKCDFHADSTVDADKSIILGMHHAERNARLNKLNPSPEKVLMGTMHEKPDTEKIKGQVVGASSTTVSFLEYAQATICNHSGAIGIPEGFRIAQVKCQEGCSSNTVASKGLENTYLESGQVDLINSKLSTLSGSSPKEAVRSAEFHKIVMKQKLSKPSHKRNMKIGPKRLFLAYLNLTKKNVKKRKHRRTKKRPSHTKGNQKPETFEDNVQGIQGTSASVTVNAFDVEGVQSTKKRTCNNFQREKGIADDAHVTHSKKKKCHTSLRRGNGVHGRGDVNILNSGSINAKDPDGDRRQVRNSAETSLSLDGVQLSTDPISRNSLTRGSGEVIVHRWNEIDSPAEVVSTIDDEPKSTGYMMDNWKKKQGQCKKKKKVKRSTRLLVGGNHFQDFPTVRIQKTTRMDHANSGNKPFRIFG